MSVSSVNPYLAALYAQYYTSGIGTATTQSGQSSSSSAAVKGISGVDSFELSSPATLAGYTADMAGANRAQFGPPPPPPGDSANSSGSSTDDPVKSFLDKVAAGTVTDEDLASMQTVLQNLGAASATSSSDPIGSFLGKVAAGTVTDEDLTNMKTILENFNATKAQFGPPPPPPGDSANSSGDSTGDPIKSFLDKVAAGTVTDEDLTSMQTLLQHWQQSAAK